MSLIVWNDNYSVGVNRLDDDHIVIFSLINHVHDAHGSGADVGAIGRLLEVLVDRASAHFQREEALMKAHAYPDMAAHLAEHQEILEQLGALHDAYRARPSADLSMEIIALLCTWLEDHILESDKRYRPWLA